MIQSSRSPKKGKLEIPTERINRFKKKKNCFQISFFKKAKEKTVQNSVPNKLIILPKHKITCHKRKFKQLKNHFTNEGKKMKRKFPLCRNIKNE